MRRRTERQNVKQQTLVVTLPAVRNETAFRMPAVADRAVFGLCPLPVGATIQRLGQIADFALLHAVADEKLCSGQHASQQERTIHCRKFAMPCATAALHIQKMIVEP